MWFTVTRRLPYIDSNRARRSGKEMTGRRFTRLTVCYCISVMLELPRAWNRGALFARHAVSER
jgi:hypothetical protein